MIKNIKLMLLGLMAVVSANAFASVVGATFTATNGVEYKVTKAYTAATTTEDAIPGQVTVISYKWAGEVTTVEIPGVVKNPSVTEADEFRVTAISAAAFQNSKISTIVLPIYVTEIAANTFNGSTVETVVIPAGSKLISIGESAFEKATKLTTFNTANAPGLKEIGMNAFKGCAGLTAITVGADLVSIGDGAFLGTGITTLDLSASTKLNAINRWFTDTSISYSTNSKLTTVKLSAENAVLKEIGENAFSGCTALTAIGETAGTAALPKYITTISKGAFLQTKIQVLDLSLCTKLATLAEGSFSCKGANNDPSQLVTVKFPATTTGGYNTIAAGLFKDITTFKNVNADNKVPSYIKTIEDGAFQGTAIEKLDLSGNGNIGAIGDWFTKTVPGTSTSTLKQIVLKANKDYSFSTNLANLTTLTKVGVPGAEYQIPAGSTLAEGMFAGTALPELDLSKLSTLTELPALFGAAGISTLTKVTLHQNTVNLAANAFAGCSALASLNNINKLTSVGKSAFWQTALSSLTFGTPLTTLTTPFAVIDGASDAQKKLPYSTAKSLSIDLSASTSITTIAENTFQNVAALTSIKLPAKVTSIGANAFEGTGIAEITIPATVEDENAIATGAFKNCKSLKKLTYMPSSPTNIPFAAGAFEGCGLVTIYTTAAYIKAHSTAPTNTKYADGSAKNFTTVKDKVGTSCYKGFYDDTYDYQFDMNEVANVYEGDLDGENIRLYPMRNRGGKINVPAGTAVIVKTTEVKEVKPTQIEIDGSTVISSSMLNTENCLKSVSEKTARESVPEYGNYMYVFVNPDNVGFTFQYFSGSYINNGNIYVISPKVPESAAARLGMIWYDENGNVVEENTTTAINGLESDSENGEMFNLAGQKVNANYRGVVIMNGKKMIQK